MNDDRFAALLLHEQKRYQAEVEWKQRSEGRMKASEDYKVCCWQACSMSLQLLTGGMEGCASRPHELSDVKQRLLSASPCTNAIRSSLFSGMCAAGKRGT